MKKTRIIWRRTGKAHGEDAFKVNPPDIIAASLGAKLARFAAPKTWRWWQFNDEVLVEVPTPNQHYKPTTRIYYLPRRHCVAIADLRFGGNRRERFDYEPELYWYLHIADIAFAPTYDAWVFTDLFTDVLASRDGLIYRVKDLDDLAEVLQLGLIDPTKAATILRHTQDLLETLRTNHFPFPELQAAMDADEALMQKVEDSTL